MTVLGTTYNGTVPFSETPTIDGVTFGGNPATPTVTVSGTGFGSTSDLGTPAPASCGASGTDYGNNFSFSDTTRSWQAGQGAGCIGLIISSYSNNQIVFTFGTGYSTYGPPRPGQLCHVGARAPTHRHRLARDRLHL